MPKIVDPYSGERKFYKGRGRKIKEPKVPKEPDLPDEPLQSLSKEQVEKRRNAGTKTMNQIYRWK